LFSTWQRHLFQGNFSIRFDIAAKPIVKKGRSFTYPAERIDIKNGIVTVSGQKFIVSDIKAENVNVNNTLSFEAHIQNNDLIGKIDVRGEGTYNRRKTDVKAILISPL